MFTDGKASDVNHVPAAAQAWARAGVTVFAVGIGHGINHKGTLKITVVLFMQSRVNLQQQMKYKVSFIF